MPFRVPGQTTLTRAFSAMVRAADPNFDRDRRKEPEYQFEGGNGTKRTFNSDVRRRFPYNQGS